MVCCRSLRANHKHKLAKGIPVCAQSLPQPQPFFTFCIFFQKTIGEILASMEIFSRFETILEVSMFGSAPGRCGVAAVAKPAAVFVGILNNI